MYLSITINNVKKAGVLVIVATKKGNIYKRKQNELLCMSYCDRYIKLLTIASSIQFIITLDC